MTDAIGLGVVGLGFMGRRYARFLSGIEGVCLAGVYDLDSDPHQDRNVIADHPDVVAKMRVHLDAWWAEVEPAVNRLERSGVRRGVGTGLVFLAITLAIVGLDAVRGVAAGPPSGSGPGWPQPARTSR